MRNVKGIMILLAFSVVLLCSCGSGNVKKHSKKPDDELSKSIKDQLGSDFYYQGKEDTDSEIIYYNYYIEKKDKNSVASFIKIVNQYAGNGDKIQIKVWTIIPGGYTQVFGISNFFYEKTTMSLSDHICYLYICDADHAMSSLVNDPQLYTSIDGIEELHIEESMQKKAEEAGIDWYEIWPDLETMVVEKR